jgi:hypothetical protein
MSPRTLKYLKRHIQLPIYGDWRTVLDVGAGDITGSPRRWFTDSGFTYHGADIEPSKDVHYTIDKSCEWNLGRCFDVIVSLNTFEHVDKPWTLIKTMAQHLNSQGMLLIVAPFSFQFHRHPIDCWRYTPDSMQVLANESELTLVHSYLDYEAGPTFGMLSDIVWLIRRSKWKDAFKVMIDWWERPPAIHCVGVFRKS